mgnify:CR=1 FL=1
MALPVQVATCFGLLGFMKSQIPSTKLQINYKVQYPMTKTCLELSYFKIMYRFGILNFGHCDLEFLVSPADCRKVERVWEPLLDTP